MKSHSHFVKLASVSLAIVAVVACSIFMSAQTTISTGNIQGTVTDPSGAVVGGARVTITNKATGQSITTSTTSSGTYASGALIPGEYQVKIEAEGFKTVLLPVTVAVNTTASGNVKLPLGQTAELVNTEQATVQGVLTSEQIENLPINGRNFLDLAQLEPGIQIQDGGTFDPTKNGFSSVSFGGRFGRTARIEVDGVDVSDETVGTTTQNLPLGAIQESSLQQSSLDLSTELTSSGSVNVATKSGTNSLHGEGFYDFRDQVLNANLPGATHNPFQRNQYGGSLGGPILKDKLFFFIDGERTKQDLIDPVIPGGAFSGLSGNITSPFRETETIGRLDWQARRFKSFYRFSFEQNRSVLPFIPNSFQPFANVNHSRDHVVGTDFNTGSFTHSIRFGYTKFENGITDAVTGSSIFNPAPGIELAIGADPNCVTAGLDVFCSGPNYLAPQATFQSNHQIKYDGGKTYKNHIFRYGFGFNRLKGGGFAEFLGTAPAVGSPTTSTAANAFTGGAANPLNYPAVSVTLGNGQGFSSLKPAFGFPAGGLGPDNRLSWYFGDSWKIKSNFTLNYGLRYVRDTGRTDSDLGPLPVLNLFNNQFYSGLGNRVNQPNLNFAPQLGLAWDPSKKGKTVIRAGIGLFYENSIWNNVLFDPAARLQKGLFLASTPVCTSGQPQPLPFASNIDPASICGQPIGSVSSQITQLQRQYQAAIKAAGPTSNPSYIGTTLLSGIDMNTTSVLAPNYVTPRSVQMNFGIQKEIRLGMILSADYLRNVATHNLLSVDTNHVGDARFFNLANAQAAINETLAKCGVSTIDLAIASCPGLHPTGGGATISDFASFKGQVHHLDSGYTFGGGPCSTCAFPGINSSVGANQLLFPIGRSVYNGLQMSLKQDVHNPFRGIRYMNLQVSYALSRYVATARDSDFINFSQDNANPTRYIGPNGLDRKHQISFGGTADLPAGFRMSVISHFDSPLPLNLYLPVTGTAGGIFVSDVTGDGTGDGNFSSNGSLGDLLPGTKLGAFGRSITAGSINKAIQNYNQNFAGQPTPAGQALVSNGLFTSAQLQALGGVMQPVALAPARAVGQAWLKTFDLGLSWGYKFKDRVELRPGLTFFNLFNFANFDGPAAPSSGVLDGTPGSPNGTTNPQPNALRLGLGSGVNALGSPRVVEFELKLVF